MCASFSDLYWSPDNKIAIDSPREEASSAEQSKGTKIKSKAPSDDIEMKQMYASKRYFVTRKHSLCTCTCIYGCICFYLFIYYVL